MKDLFDTAIGAETFRGKALISAILPALANFPELRAAHDALVAAWPKKPIGAGIFLGIVRWSFLIELVKAPKIETTKFEVRWADRLGNADPRFATYEECLEMCIALAKDAAASVADGGVRDLLAAFFRHNLVPYELPVDYSRREKAGRLHAAANVEWLWGGVPRKTVLLRDHLLSGAVGEHLPTFDAAYSKIQVKTYLTDRVLTGTHKTNREKRWETHPASVHFALRRDCLEIEYVLMMQLCHFTGFPAEVREQLRERNLIDSLDGEFRCPVTLEPLSFKEFEQAILNPVMGKSSFQVGHLNPLKAVNDDPRSGHTARNISWVSADGNRIQGSLSMEDTRTLIRRIAVNYEKFGVK